MVGFVREFLAAREWGRNHNQIIHFFENEGLFRGIRGRRRRWLQGRRGNRINKGVTTWLRDQITFFSFLSLSSLLTAFAQNGPGNRADRLKVSRLMTRSTSEGSMFVINELQVGLKPPKLMDILSGNPLLSSSSTHIWAKVAKPFEILSVSFLMNFRPKELRMEFKESEDQRCKGRFGILTQTDWQRVKI